MPALISFIYSLFYLGDEERGDAQIHTDILTIHTHHHVHILEDVVVYSLNIPHEHN